MIPFTYILKFKPTGQYYYGVRFAHNCDPADLWNTYFTSSKVIHKLIKEYGKTAFEHKISKVFVTSTEALEHEHKFLERVNARANAKFLNRSNGSSNFVWSNKGLKIVHHKIFLTETTHDPSLPLPDDFVYGTSASHRANLSRSLKGMTAWNKNKKIKPTGPCSDTRKENIKKSRLQTEKTSCPHCGKLVDPGNFKAYHGDKCKHNPNIDPQVLIERSNRAKLSLQKQKETGTFSKPKLVVGLFTCPHCNFTSTNYAMMQRLHFNRCKTIEQSSSDI